MPTHSAHTPSDESDSSHRICFFCFTKYESKTKIVFHELVTDSERLQYYEIIIES